MDTRNLVGSEQNQYTKRLKGIRQGHFALENNPKVAIIVLHYGNPDDTLECLRSIIELQYENVFLVVLDNGTEPKYSILAYKNTINDLTQAKNWKFEDLSASLTGLSIKGEPRTFYLLRTEKNLLWAGGNNYCIKLIMPTNPDWIWLLNNDTAFSPETLTRLLETARSRALSMMSPYLYDYSNHQKLQFPGGVFFAPWFPANSFLVRIDRILARKKANYLSGAALLVKAEVFSKVGFFDENLFYWEETDLCIRARKHGLRIGTCKEAIVFHKMSAATDLTFSDDRKEQNYAKGLFVNFLRHKGPLFLYFLILFLVFLPIEFLRLILAPILELKKKVGFKKRLKLFQRFWEYRVIFSIRNYAELRKIAKEPL